MQFVADELSTDLDALAKKHGIQLVGAGCPNDKDKPYRVFHVDGNGGRDIAQDIRALAVMAVWGSGVLTRAAVEAAVHAAALEWKVDEDEEWRRL